MVWESTQKLESKRTIADLEIAERSETYPVNYLLDGQQRLSTICGALHWPGGNPRSVWNLVFDLRNATFVHVDKIDDIPLTQIPLRRLSSPADYFSSLGPIDDSTLKARATELFERFMEYQVALVTLGDMSIDDVAPVFERINSTGTRLTIYDLMRAATWSTKFDLGSTVEGIKSALEPKKFHALDNKTFLRILGAAAGNDFSAQSIDALRDMELEKLDATAEVTKAAALRAADFVSTQIGAPRAEALPYANQFVVLSELFRVLPHPDSAQLDEMKRWFWLTTLSGYFGGWDSGQMTTDTRAIRAFARDESETLGQGGVVPSAAVWRVKPFRANSAVSKMLALMITHEGPIDLLNGQKIDVGKSLAWSNDKEFHHFFPKAYISREKKSEDANLVANIIMLTSASNIAIKDRAPKDYLGDLVSAVGRDEVLRRLASNLVPEAGLDCALDNDYTGFLDARSEHVHRHALALAGQEQTNLSMPDELDDDDADPSE